MRSSLLLALLLLLATPALAQDHAEGVISDVASSMEMVRGRILALAEAMPDDKLSWRPAEGVRSVSEAMVHVAAANYFFASLMGKEMPEGIDPRGMEQSITDKAGIIAAVNASFDYMAGLLDGLEADDLSAPARWFDGSEKPTRFLLHFTSTHAHEHLGQLIAYARTNGVVPPWSE
jgi:uncharacterized damage-inducible protein DinB